MTYLQFQSVFADGVATPGAMVGYALNDEKKDYQGVSLASYSYKYPDSSSFDSAFSKGTTKYKALEKTYPEHTFQIVKPYDKYNGNYYVVCEDERGIQFKVHTIMYDNRYHFGCYDEYLLEILQKGNLINKAEEIAKKHGYVIDYDKDNQTLALEIDVDYTVDTSGVAETIVEILYIPMQMNHLHGLYEPVSRRMRSTLTETEPRYYFVNRQAFAC